MNPRPAAGEGRFGMVREIDCLWLLEDDRAKIHVVAMVMCVTLRDAGSRWDCNPGDRRACLLVSFQRLGCPAKLVGGWDNYTTATPGVVFILRVSSRHSRMHARMPACRCPCSTTPQLNQLSYHRYRCTNYK